MLAVIILEILNAYSNTKKLEEKIYLYWWAIFNIMIESLYHMWISFINKAYALISYLFNDLSLSAKS